MRPDRADAGGVAAHLGFGELTSDQALGLERTVTAAAFEPARAPTCDLPAVLAMLPVRSPG